MAANFGLLLPGADGKGWQFACEESFGGRLSDRIRTDGRGRIFAPASTGLYLSTDTCGWHRATGAVDGSTVWDVAVDATGGATAQVWALASDPRTVLSSTDGGEGFVVNKVFGADLRFYRLVIAPSDAAVMYVVGYAAKIPYVAARSDNRGATWTVDDTTSAFPPEVRTVEFLGVHPEQPQTVFVRVENADTGDQIWKSTNAGRSWRKVLTLDTAEAQWGFAFGASGQTVFAAGRPILERQGTPTGHLYSSHDGGETWDPPVASGQQGPRYRCLDFRDGRLLACGGDQLAGDAFLLGASDDEGKTWTPVIRLADVRGPKACVADMCRATSVWLCESYDICDGDTPPAAVTDAARDVAFDAGTCGGNQACGKASGCSCQIAARFASKDLVLPFMLFIAMWVRKRRRQGKPPGES